MKHFKAILVLLLALVIGVCLTGCTTDNSGNAGHDSTNEKTAAVTDDNADAGHAANDEKTTDADKTDDTNALPVIDGNQFVNALDNGKEEVISFKDNMLTYLDTTAPELLSQAKYTMDGNNIKASIPYDGKTIDFNGVYNPDDNSIKVGNKTFKLDNLTKDNSALSGNTYVHVAPADLTQTDGAKDTAKFNELIKKEQDARTQLTFDGSKLTERNYDGTTHDGFYILRDGKIYIAISGESDNDPDTVGSGAHSFTKENNGLIKIGDAFYAPYVK